MKRIHLLLALSLSWSLSYGADFTVSKSKPLRKQYSEKESFSLNLTNVVGINRIYSKKDGVIEVEATTSGSEVTLTSELSGGELNIEVKYPGNFAGGGTVVSRVTQNGNSISIQTSRGGTVIVDGEVVQGNGGKAGAGVAPVNVSIGIPNDLLQNMKIRSASGQIVIDGAFERLSRQREVSVDSISGDLKVSGLSAERELNLKTVSGNVRLDRVSGPLVVKSVSGDISITEGLGDIDAHNTSGDITIKGRTADLVEAHSVSGDIRFNCPGVKKERARSLSGDVTYTDN